MDAIDYTKSPKKIETPTGNPEVWLIGMKFDDAKDLLLQRGMTIRAVRRQGLPCPVTRDVRAFRWNVAVSFNDTIIEVFGRG